MPKIATVEDGYLDDLAYSRSMDSLIKEVKKPQPRQENVKKLMELTFNDRREKINGALIETKELLNEYPFFKTKKWVSWYVWYI